MVVVVVKETPTLPSPFFICPLFLSFALTENIKQVRKEGSSCGGIILKPLFSPGPYHILPTSPFNHCSNFYILLFLKGMFWIDPNGGTIKDAIWVFCDKGKNSSCIYPKNSKVGGFGSCRNGSIVYFRLLSIIWTDD